MENTIASRENLRDEKINSEVIDTKSVSNFMKYYISLIEIAVKYGIVEDSQKSSIAATIYSSIKERVGEEQLLISNMIYLLTVYLMQFPKIDSIKKLLSKTLIDEAITNYNKYAILMSESMTRSNKSVLEIGDNDLIEDYQELKEMVSNFFQSISENPIIDLKKYHEAKVALSFYNMYKDVEEISYPARLLKFVLNFEIEVNILNKLNTNGLIQKLKSSDLVLKTKTTSNRIKSLKKSYDDTCYEIQMAKEKKDSEIIGSLKKQNEQEKIFQKITDEFEKLHPELEDGTDEYEKLYDSFFNERTKDLEDFDEPDEIKEKYNALIQKLNKKLDQIESELNEEEVNVDVDKSMIDMHYSLDRIIKENYIFVQVQNGSISKPQNAKEKGNVLLNVTKKEALKYFLPYSKELNLSNEEMNYLISE